MKIIVTSTASTQQEPSLQAFLSECGWEFVPRQGRSINKLRTWYQADAVLVWEPGGPVLYVDDEKFFFHPSMAKNRLGLYRKKGIPDLMVRVCDIQPGDKILDCTLGLGADAIVAAYFAKTDLVGLESAVPLARVVKWGMKMYSTPFPWLEEAIKRIQVIPRDHQSYLEECPSDSFDIVYFDPMFQQPLLKSQPLNPLRKLADHRPLTEDSIEQACRVARKKVVLKERSDSLEFERLGFQKLVRGSNKLIAYGTITVNPPGNRS